MLKTLPGPDFSARTTLHLGGRALAEVVFDHPDDACGLGEALSRLGGRPMALGGGSNILARDGELPLVVVNPRLVGDPVTLKERFDGNIRVRVGGGVKLQRFVAWLATQGLDALPGLAGVPGTVGAAVAGNAGSFGRQMGDVLARVQVWTPEGGVVWVGRDGFTAGYRSFAVTGVTGFYLVLAAEFDCQVREPIAIRQEMIANLVRKRATQPIKAASAGCVFKNPPGTAAGKLLEEAGFRGKRLGGMAFSEIHANFLVNCGNGTSGEAFDLVEAAREAVRGQSGYVLELEVRVVS